MEHKKESSKQAVSEISAASKKLAKTLMEARREHSGMPHMGVHVNGRNTTTQAEKLVITIHGDTLEQVNKIGTELQAQGWICQSTGPTEAECVCPNPDA